MSERFWTIWRESGGGAQKRYEVKWFAIKEAERLSAQTGENYYVLEAIGIVKPKFVPFEICGKNKAFKR